MADGGHIEFRKVLISAYGMKIVVQNLVQRCKTTTRRCPRDQKRQQRNRKLIHVTSFSQTSGSTVRRCQWLHEMFEPDFEQSSRNRRPSWRNVANSLIVKIQDGGGPYIEFRKMSISSDKMKIFPPNLWTDLFASRPYWDDLVNWNWNRKLIRVTSSGFQPTCIWSPYWRMHESVAGLV